MNLYVQFTYTGSMSFKPINQRSEELPVAGPKILSLSLSHVVCCSLLCSRLRWSQTRRNSDSETLGPCLKCSSLYTCVLFQNGQSMLFLLINGINFSWGRYKCRDDINNRLELTCILEIFASCLLSKMKQGLNESQFLAFPFH